MPIAYLVIGDGNTRKSSTIRALTGAAQHRVLTIATTASRIDVYVRISALQESGISSDAYIQEVSVGGYTHVMVPLWASAHKTLPAATTYIREFLAAGWQIAQVAVLGGATVTLPPNVPAPTVIAASATMPANEVASQLRAVWRWL